MLLPYRASGAFGQTEVVSLVMGVYKREMSGYQCETMEDGFLMFVYLFMSASFSAETVLLLRK